MVNDVLYKCSLEASLVKLLQLLWGLNSAWSLAKAFTVDLVNKSFDWIEKSRFFPFSQDSREEALWVIQRKKEEGWQPVREQPR